MKTLNVIYDLQIAPCSYDFFAFLLSAETHRLRNGFKKICIYFVPGDKNGFRNDNLRSDSQNQQFFLNVILPGTHLLESIKSIHWLHERSDLFKFPISDHDVFPRGYNIVNPITDYTMHGLVTAYFRQEKPVIFSCPKYSLNIANDILENLSINKKIITLTVRELERDDTNQVRKINHSVWKNVFKKLENTKYQPIVIRDTCNAHISKPLFENVPEIKTASYHIHIRYSIYNLAHLNFFKNNGTWLPAFYSKSNVVAFNKFDNEQYVLSETWFKNNYGMTKGCQFPLTTQNSFLEWEAENEDIILDHIDRFSKEFPKDEKKLWPFHNLNNIIDTAQVAINQTLFNLKFDACLEDLIVFKNLKSHILNGNIANQNIKEALTSLEGKVIPKENLKKLFDLDKKYKFEVFV